MGPREGSPVCRHVTYGGCCSEADDDEGDVVVAAPGDPESFEEGVREPVGGGVGQAAQRFLEAVQAGVDVLSSALDQAVGVKDEGVAAVKFPPPKVCGGPPYTFRAPVVPSRPAMGKRRRSGCRWRRRRRCGHPTWF